MTLWRLKALCQSMNERRSSVWSQAFICCSLRPFVGELNTDAHSHRGFFFPVIKRCALYFRGSEHQGERLVCPRSPTVSCTNTHTLTDNPHDHVRVALPRLSKGYPECIWYFRQDNFGKKKNDAENDELQMCFSLLTKMQILWNGCTVAGRVHTRKVFS